jgi:ubiquinone/menaquinone biosynthesis C-methylase UbiE
MKLADEVTQQSAQTTAILSSGYDAVYSAIETSPTLRRLWHEYAEGPDFPKEFGHISLTTLPEIRRIAAQLRVSSGDTFVGLGCGLAGPALWMARETGANLIGVDLSAVAVERATDRAAELGLADQARFVVGSFAETGLETESVDGAMSEDALQYAPSKDAAFREAARILRRGKHFTFTAYELDPDRAANVLLLNADPVEDFRPALALAGFEVEVYEEVSGWPEPMAAAYSAIIGAAKKLEQEMGEAAVRALVTEMTLTLEHRPYTRRIFASAKKK